MRARVLYAELRGTRGRFFVRARPDPARTDRAFAHVGGHALALLDAEPGPRDELETLTRALSVAPADAAVHDVLASAACALDGTFTPLRVVSVDQKVPRWPVSLRTGAGVDRVWPFDLELAGILGGTRTLLFREGMRSAEADADAAWLSRAGLVVRRVASEDGEALFAGVEAGVVDEAIDRQRRACIPDAGQADAMRWMGTALGYPPCCITAFSRVRARDDVTTFAELLPRTSAPPSSPLGGFLVGALALVSHAPCSPACEATRVLALSHLHVLERTSPRFWERWSALATRLCAVDVEGRSWVLAVDGSLPEGVVVRDAVELVVPHSPDEVPRIARDRPSLVGLHLSVRDHSLVSDDGTFEATLFVDQRAQDSREPPAKHIKS